MGNKATHWTVALLGAAMLTPLLSPNAPQAADYTAKDITTRLFASDQDGPANYSGKDLSFLDLAGLDFKKSDLGKANLYGTDLSRTRLAGSNLAGAVLDRASLALADLSGADLRGATLLTVSAHTTTEWNPKDAPRFIGANLTDAVIASRLDGADFSDANLTRARLGTMEPTWGSFRPRAVLRSANFNGATLVSTNLSTAVLHFAVFTNANLSNADLSGCDFSQANLSGANLSGANVAGADFYGVDLTGVVGLDSAVGLELAKNLKRPTP
jgi:uncharacterized protein YjbI with pentapeptide repeats